MLVEAGGEGGECVERRRSRRRDQMHWEGNAERVSRSWSRRAAELRLWACAYKACAAGALSRCGLESEGPSDGLAVH